MAAAVAREALMVKNKVCRYFFSQKAFEETDNASMGIVRKVWKQGHVIRKKKYFGEDAGYLANTNLILRALRKDKTKFSA